MPSSRPSPKRPETIAMLQSKRRSSSSHLNRVWPTAGERVARPCPTQFLGSSPPALPPILDGRKPPGSDFFRRSLLPTFFRVPHRPKRRPCLYETAQPPEVKPTTRCLRHRGSRGRVGPCLTLPSFLVDLREPGRAARMSGSPRLRRASLQKPDGATASQQAKRSRTNGSAMVQCTHQICRAGFVDGNAGMPP